MNAQGLAINRCVGGVWDREFIEDSSPDVLAGGSRVLSRVYDLWPVEDRGTLRLLAWDRG